MENNKCCYVCSPIAYFYENYNICVAKEKAKNYAVMLSDRVMALGYIPVSAPLCLLDIIDETSEREKGLKCSMEILKRCEVVAYKQEDYVRSKGIREEVRVAIELKKEIVKL